MAAGEAGTLEAFWAEDWDRFQARLRAATPLMRAVPQQRREPLNRLRFGEHLAWKPGETLRARTLPDYPGVWVRRHDLALPLRSTHRPTLRRAGCGRGGPGARAPIAAELRKGGEGLYATAQHCSPACCSLRCLV